ncbi:MAG TPA: sugar porter family MFS transporter [Tepidisphaeraceae bacterium]|jgi:SP family arabinose:H+ symporter-like MFS transporter|nr:sugar porter family MFS transporter [Tepidisphaeraceae bacterium]
MTYGTQLLTDAPTVLQRKISNLVIATLAAVLGGYLYGYDTLVISGAIDYLTEFYKLDAGGKGQAASCALIGCFIGAISAGWVVDRLGAKVGLWLCAICFAGSSIGTYFAGSLSSFIFWRILAGLGLGMASIVAPMYIAEIAPTGIRGRLVTLYQFGIVLGILSAVFINKLIHGLGDEMWNLNSGWRYMFMASAAPAILFAAMIMPAVESPRWLMKMKRREEALNILRRLNGPEIAAVEAQEIEQSLNKEEGKFSELFTTGFRRPLVIGIVLAGLSQASGIFVLLTFLKGLLEGAGFSRSSAFSQTVLVGAILAIFTLAALALVDLAGRKTLLVLGTLAQFVSMAAVAWLFNSQGHGLAILVFFLIFVAAHAAGNGAVCWVIISEIFPTKIRGRAMSVATTSLFLVAYLGNLVYPAMQEHLGYSGTFWCFSAAALINLLYVLFQVPETKGRSLEQIEKMWVAQGE